MIALFKKCLFAFGLLYATSATAFTLHGEAWPEDSVPVEYWISLDMTGTGSPSSDEIASVQMGADTWGNDGFANFSYTYAGTNSDNESEADNGINTIMSFNATGWCLEVAVGSATGLVNGYNSYWTEINSDGIEEITDSYVVICTADEMLDGSILTRNWNFTTTSPASDELDLASTIAHEMGHMLGLYHSCEATADTSTGEPACGGGCNTGTNDLTEATMCWSNQPGDDFQRDLATDDIDGLQAIYGEIDADSDRYTVSAGDCDDTDATVNPSATENCSDSIDNDCDGTVNNGCVYDTDGDGLTDGEETALGTDPDDADSDDDGLSDGDEVNTYITDPNDSDSDDDSLSDYNEVANYGTDPSDTDTDNDGLTDELEVAYGMDPNDSGDNIAAIYTIINYLLAEDTSSTTTVAVDDDGDGYTEDDGDCNDADSSIHPDRRDCGTLEFFRFRTRSITFNVANGVDQDCDGTADEDTCSIIKTPGLESPSAKL